MSKSGTIVPNMPANNARRGTERNHVFVSATAGWVKIVGM